jgi:hypothetical protein
MSTHDLEDRALSNLTCEHAKQDVPESERYPTASGFRYAWPSNFWTHPPMLPARQSIINTILCIHLFPPRRKNMSPQIMKAVLYLFTKEGFCLSLYFSQIGLDMLEQRKFLGRADRAWQKKHMKDTFKDCDTASEAFSLSLTSTKFSSSWVIFLRSDWLTGGTNAWISLHDAKAVFSNNRTCQSVLCFKIAVFHFTPKNFFALLDFPSHKFIPSLFQTRNFLLELLHLGIEMFIHKCTKNGVVFCPAKTNLSLFLMKSFL